MAAAECQNFDDFVPHETLDNELPYFLNYINLKDKNKNQLASLISIFLIKALASSLETRPEIWEITE